MKINQDIHPINISGWFSKTEKERRDRELWNAMAETAKMCGCRGDDVTFQVINTLKKIGRYDMLPPCERGKRSEEGGLVH